MPQVSPIFWMLFPVVLILMVVVVGVFMKSSEEFSLMDNLEEGIKSSMKKW